MRSLWVGATLLLLVVLVSGCFESPSDLPASPLFLKFDVVGQPVVNNTFTLLTTFGLRERAPYWPGIYDGTIVYVNLPGNIEVTSGPTNWTGVIDNQTNIVFTLNTSLRITKEGGYTIDGFIKGPSDEHGSWWGDHKSFYIESSQYGYRILPWDPAVEVDQGRPVYNKT